MFECTICGNGKKHKMNSPIGKEHYELMQGKLQEKRDAIDSIDELIDITSLPAFSPKYLEKLVDNMSYGLIAPGKVVRNVTKAGREIIESVKKARAEMEWHPNFVMNRMECSTSGDTDGSIASKVRDFTFIEHWLYAPSVARAHHKKWHWWNQRKRKKMLKYYGIDEQGNKLWHDPNPIHKNEGEK